MVYYSANYKDLFWQMLLVENLDEPACSFYSLENRQKIKLFKPVFNDTRKILEN